MTPKSPREMMAAVSAHRLSLGTADEVDAAAEALLRAAWEQNG